MVHLKIVGDIHGMVKNYSSEIVDNCRYSIQVGDFGFDYSGMDCLNPENHRFFGGNHDNYDLYNKSPHALGDNGDFSLGGFNFHYIRGAFSVDRKDRFVSERKGNGKSWWEEEQLTIPQMDKAFNAYRASAPRTMLSHTCPTEIAKKIGNSSVLKFFGFNAESFNTQTQALLQYCFDAHRPNVWIFGHFHMDLMFTHKGTLFICLKENGVLNVDKNGHFGHKNIFIEKADNV